MLELKERKNYELAIDSIRSVPTIITKWSDI
jgi:hypothetical protein